MKAHATKYSKTYEKYKSWLWKDDYEKMWLKTVIKLHLNSGKAPLDPLMELAIKADQWIAQSDSLDTFDYVDNPPEPEIVSSITNDIDPDLKDWRIKNLAKCESLQQLEEMQDQSKPTDPQILALFTQRKNDIIHPKVQSKSVEHIGHNGEPKEKKWPSK